VLFTKGEAVKHVYLLMKHPPYPYSARAYLKAGECQGVYLDRAEPARIAQEKNSRNPYCFWAVQRKQIKDAA
jgi:hypothetical protein